MASIRSVDELVGRVRTDVHRAVLRAKHGIRYVIDSEAPDVGRTPRELVWSRDKARLWRFRSDARRLGPPVVLVHSLVSRSYILDLVPDGSFAGRLLEAGHDVFLFDWGVPDAVDATNTLETYVGDYIAEGVEAVCDRTGVASVTVLGYCFGGVLALLYALLRPERVENLVTMATPIDFSTLGPLSGMFQAGRLEPDEVIDETGNVPADVMHSSFKILRPTGEAVQYVNLWQNLWNDEFVAGYRAINHWTRDHIPFAGAAFRQTVETFLRDNALVSGTVRFDGRTHDLAAITCPLLNVYAELDHVVQPESSRPLGRLVASTDVEELPIPGGHAALVVGRQAVQVTSPGIIEWLGRHGHRSDGG